MKVVFDVAGVLLHWRPAALVARLLPQHAPDEAAAERLVQGIFTGFGGDWGEFDRGTLAATDLVRRIAARTGLREHEVALIVDAVPHELRPMQDTVALLRELRDAGAPVYFLSNMPAPYALQLEAAHEFFGWFVDGVWSARVQAIKPQAEIYQVAAGRFGEPGELHFLDDQLPNVEAARAAGWQAWHFTDADSSRHWLQQVLENRRP